MNHFADWTKDEVNEVKKGLIVTPSIQRRVFNDESKDEDSFSRSLDELYQDHYHLRRIKRSMIKRRYQQEYDGKRGIIDWFFGLFSSDSSNENNGNTVSLLPSSFDWRSQNVVSSVKNQLQCGCCYAFASGEVLESVYAIKTKKPVTEFSPQQIIDCSKSTDGNHGCDGGNFASSISYLRAQGSKIATLASYPFAGKEQTCKKTGINQITLVNLQYTDITSGDEKGMAEALVRYGPLFIGLNADSKLFMFYKSGVLNIDNCLNTLKNIDHALVAVGYGYDNTLKMPYWIIRNSWGDTWGEKGYVRLAKDKGNMCGVSTMTSYATL
jgi:C1A family cysteine protease